MGAVATCALLAGCGGGASVGQTAHEGGVLSGGVLPAQAAIRSIASTASQNVVYIGNISSPPGSGEVFVYPAGVGDKNPALIRTITNGTRRPSGLWVDAKGTLYVANIPDGAASIGITEFHAGASSPFRTLNGDLTYPEAVAVGPDGTVYVNNSVTLQGGDGDLLTVFPPNSTHPSHAIEIPNSGYAFNAGELAFAHDGDLLAIGTSFTHGTHVFDVNTTTFQASEVPLDLTNVQGPGLAVDSTGNIYISGDADDGIEVFSGTTFKVIRKIPDGAFYMYFSPDDTMYADLGDGVAEYLRGAQQPANV
ncbi:MAG TPA: SBBP repeat-containing protein, partial [Candidatus Eremiobacteraceae bacterium]|nr:SBBP repeat-containing protein [Candidatus Eremiobacteraceae bacterium]